MALKIDASSLFSRNYFIVKRDRVKVLESGMLFGARQIRFAEIGCVLMSPADVLSIQVGHDVYSIQTRPKKPKHQAAVAALLQGVEASKLPPGSAVRYPL